MNIMFQPQFEPLILSGQKIHTIRPSGKFRTPVGMALSLRVWTGRPYRSKQREIMPATVKDVKHVVIEENRVILDYISIAARSRQEFARNDGFKDFADLRAWFVRNHSLPFVGKVIYWTGRAPVQPYATAQRDGFTVPLIGVSASAQPSAGDFRDDPLPAGLKDAYPPTSIGAVRRYKRLQAHLKQEEITSL